MLFFLEDFNYGNHVNDSTPYENKGTWFIANDVEQSSLIIFKWLNDNRMEGNIANNYFLVPGNFRASVKIDNNQVQRLILTKQTV